jgi:hypothetical protein
MEEEDKRQFAAMRLHPATVRYLESLGEKNLGRAVDSVILPIIGQMPDPSIFMSGSRHKRRRPTGAVSPA